MRSNSFIRISEKFLKQEFRKKKKSKKRKEDAEERGEKKKQKKRFSMDAY
jgi:hypothetical protein